VTAPEAPTRLTIAELRALGRYVEGCPTCERVKAAGGFGPSHWGSPGCQSGSLAAGGKNTHCTCDGCF